MDLSSDKLVLSVRTIYAKHHQKLHFHTWYHTQFVRKHAVAFANELGAGALIVDLSALLHYLNYIVAAQSAPDIGRSLRGTLLDEAGYSGEIASAVEEIILQSHTANRSAEISLEAKALSDADTLFKTLPITPILFAHKYMSENDVSIQVLAEKVVEEQRPLFDRGCYFYTTSAKKKYKQWAETNIKL